ncbi:LOB domain-containing protein 15 [Capsicum chacoense]
MSRERERYEEIGKKIKREADDYSQVGRRYMLVPPGSTTSNTVTPCAACKLLRRRCAQECPFSPYFSPHEPQKFASVHKVFGASNVSKMLMEVPKSQRADTANSLVYEANVRLRDPVYGCMGAISALQQQVHALQAELNVIRAEIMKYNTTSLTRSSHVTSLLSSGEVSVVALPPPPPSLILPPTIFSGEVSVVALPPPPPSLILPPTIFSADAIMYTQPSKTTTEFSTISSENNISYFG